MSFHGGLKLAHHKESLMGEEVVEAPIPEHLYLSLRMNQGDEARAVVSVGEYVLKGQCIAVADDDMVLPVHAPTSGTVTDISVQPSAAPDAAMATVITITTDGLDRTIEPMVVNIRSHQDIIELMQKSGIAGMGGAGFPAYMKYKQPVKTLIINGAECEPYIACDEALMLAKPEAVISGTDWMRQACQATTAVIAIEDTSTGIQAALEAAIQKSSMNHILVKKIPSIYPIGGEKQVIEVLTGQQVPEGQTPLVLGLLMQNVATAVALADVIESGLPLLNRFITITGDAVSRPVNVNAMIGTPLSDLLSLTEVNYTAIKRLVIGGPMMGFAMPNDAIGIDKTSNCLLAMKEELLPSGNMPCIRCGDCVQVCPQELLPQQLFWYISGESNDLEKARDHYVFDCIECGACAYVCPSHIKLVDYYRYAKAELRYLDFKKQHSDHAKQRFDARENRLERIKAERMAKRHDKTAKLKDKQVAKKEISDALARIKKIKDGQSP